MKTGTGHGYRRLLSFGVILLGLAALSVEAEAAQAPLKIIVIDVEGGAATLYITPQKHSLLIDAGWPAGMGTGRRPAPGEAPPPPTPSSAERIAAAVKAAGLTKLDYVLISHYHVDHVGGVQDLMALVPIGTFIDHGPNREMPAADTPPDRMATATVTLYPKYMDAIAGKKHIVMAAGQTLKIDDLVLRTVNSDSEVTPHPPKDAGPGADCGAATTKDANGGEENPRSVGVVAQWGRARVLALADTTWNMENRLVCPLNVIGKVDVMLADNHGSDLANSPTLLNSVKPTVVLFDNGPTKGADGAVLERVAALTGKEGIWQLHFATRSPDQNAPPDQIANLDGPDAMYTIVADVNKTGDVTLTNPRNGYSHTYKKPRG